MRSAALAGVVLLLAGCGGESSAPHWQRLGAEMYAVNCYGLAGCYARAAYVCQFGFDVIDGDQQRGGATMKSTKVGGTVVSRIESDAATRQLIVRCQAPQFCEQQSDCRFGSKCVRTKRYPDNPACSIR